MLQSVEIPVKKERLTGFERRSEETMVFEKSEAVRVTVFREKQLEGNLKKSLREAVRVHRRFKKKKRFFKYEQI